MRDLIKFLTLIINTVYKQGSVSDEMLHTAALHPWNKRDYTL